MATQERAGRRIDAPRAFVVSSTSIPPRATTKILAFFVDCRPPPCQCSIAMNKNALHHAANLTREISGFAIVESQEGREPQGLSADYPWPHFNTERPHDWYINQAGITTRVLAPHEDAGVDLDDDPEYHDPEYWQCKAEHDADAAEDR